MKPREVLVGECENGVADFPDVISSGGLGPCIAIGLLYRQRAYMLHSPLLDHEVTDENGRHAFFNRLDREIPPSDRCGVRVVLIGSQIEADDHDEIKKATLTAREFAIQELKALGFEDLCTRWCPGDPDVIQVLDIRTFDRSARVEITRYRGGEIESASEEIVALNT